MAKPRNPFERQIYTYADLRWEMRKQWFEHAYEKIGTPSGYALVWYSMIVIVLSLVAYHCDYLYEQLVNAYQMLSDKIHGFLTPPSPVAAHQIIQAPSIIPPKVKEGLPVYSDISYIPTIISGISTFGFALLFFVADFIREKGFNPTARTIIQKTLIFPLVVSSITAFSILVFFPRHPYLLGALCIYLGLMALVATTQLFKWIWIRGEPQEGGGIPAVKTMYRLFLYEIYVHNKKPLIPFMKKLRLRKLERMQKEFEEQLNEFIDGLLTYQTPRDEDYMVLLGRMLVHMRYILMENDFIKVAETKIPGLLSPYLQTLLFHDAEITNLVKREKKWIRRAAYLAITNAELALETKDKNAMSHCLTMVTALYGVLGSQNKELRDDFLDLIWRWLNEFAAYYLEPKLFEIPKNISEHRELCSLSEPLFLAYSGLIYRSYESGLEEENDDNFDEVLSAYSRVLDDYLDGGFGSKRNIEHEAEGAEYWLKNPDYAQKKPHEYQMDIEINKARLDLKMSKRGLLACIGAVIFREMTGRNKSKAEAVEQYFRKLFSQLVISFDSLLSLYLDIPGDLDDTFDVDSYLRPRTSTEKPQTYSVPNVIFDLLPPAILYLLLTTKDVTIPEAIEFLEIKGSYKYRSEKLIELLEKIERGEATWWNEKLDTEAKAKVPLLLTLLKKLREDAEEKEAEELRGKPMPSSAATTFRKAVAQGYSKSSAFIRIMKKMGLKILNQTDKKYEGKVSRFGFTPSHLKSGFLSDSQLEFAGKQFGQNMADEEARISLKKLLAKLPKEDASIEALIEKISAKDEKNTLIITNHSYWFDSIIRTKKFQEFLAMPEKDDPMPKEYGDIFRGYISISGKKYPVVGLHQDQLYGKMLIVERGDIGQLDYFSAESYGEPQKDKTCSPIFADIYAFSDRPDAAREAATKNKKAFPEIQSVEERIKRWQEFVYIQVLIRFDMEPNPAKLNVYRLRLTAKIGRRPKRKRSKDK